MRRLVKGSLRMATPSSCSPLATGDGVRGMYMYPPLCQSAVDLCIKMWYIKVHRLLFVLCLCLGNRF
jgi:hypothetical protein